MSIFLFPIIIVGIAIYFLPTIIAVARRHKNAVVIFLVNLLLGWSLVGWIVSLVWSVAG